MDYAITVRNLVKSYASKRSNGNAKLALDNLEIKVPKGSIFGLLGPNGAGKSTLINILAGTVLKTSGYADIMGVDIDQSPKDARSRIGVVPQEIMIDSFFPLAQALEFTAGYFGIRPEDRKTEEILKALNLYDKKDSLPRELSGGMKRRFLVAKAMVHSPQILILDEPTAGVDIELRDQLWEYVKKMNRAGVTIIITTHYLAEAQALCDEIAFINHGKIIKQDSTKNLLKNLGSRYIDVEFSEKIDTTKLQMANKSICEAISDTKIRFQLDSEVTDFNSLLKDISQVGFNIKDIIVAQPDLEEIFHKVLRN